MVFHEDESQWNCEFCGGLCSKMKGKTIHLMTGKKACPGMVADIKMKIKTGEIKPRNTLADLGKFIYKPIQLIRWCSWCTATWWWNEELPPEERMTECPQCTKEGYEHPKYGDRALTQWAVSRGKEIPEYLRKYLQ